jgi:hypothetical protein
VFAHEGLADRPLDVSRRGLRKGNLHRLGGSERVKMVHVRVDAAHVEGSLWQRVDQVPREARVGPAQNRQSSLAAAAAAAPAVEFLRGQERNASRENGGCPTERRGLFVHVVVQRIVEIETEAVQDGRVGGRRLCARVDRLDR